MFANIQRRKSSGGNVLFLILIAAALFAALSYVIIQSTRTSGGSAEKEKTQLEATRYLSYVNQLRVAALRVTTAGTTPDAVQLHAPGDVNTACLTGKSCIFGAEGGGAIVIDMPPDPDLDVDGNIWFYHEVADNVTALDVGTAAPDIVLSRHFTINAQGERVCRSLNEMLDIVGIPIIDGSNSGSATFPASPGQPAGCSRHFNDYYVFYAVLSEL